MVEESSWYNYDETEPITRVDGNFCESHDMTKSGMSFCPSNYDIPVPITPACFNIINRTTALGTAYDEISREF